MGLGRKESLQIHCPADRLEGKNGLARESGFAEGDWFADAVWIISPLLPSARGLFECMNPQEKGERNISYLWSRRETEVLNS